MLLILIGLISLYSIDRGSGSTNYFKTQAVRIVLGVVPFLAFYLTPPAVLMRLAGWLYAAMIASLVAVLAVGATKGGAERWIDIGPIEFQPSEMAKIIIAIVLATFFANRSEEIKRPKTFFLSLGLVALPMALILRQPHLGAVLTIFVIWLTMSMLAGVKMRALLLTVLALGGFLFVGLKVPGVLSDYHRERVGTFLFGGDSQDEYYQQLRALVAYASGGATGQGLLKGDFKGSKFVPEQQTDYISTVMGEEGGLAGCACMLGAFGFFFYRVWLVMFRADTVFAKLAAGGVFAYLAAHTIANLGMCLTLLPVVGLWLPFMSFGGTAMWLCMASVGLLLNLKRQERPVLF